MAVWSSFKKIGASSLGMFSSLLKNGEVIRNINTSSLRLGGHNKFEIRPSKWQWTKFKDYVHFYTMVGAIPIISVIVYTNIFIGPATLSEIPEGYTPHHWEYHQHPITRFIAKYFHPSPQELYEIKMDKIYEEDELLKIEKMTTKMDDLMAERLDHEIYYYKPISIRNFRLREEEAIAFRDKYSGS